MVFRIIFIGDKGCGKSSLIRRYCENDFETSYSPSLGIEKYEQIKICSTIKDNYEYKIPIGLQLWDTSSIWHPDIIKQYFAGMHCVVIIFDTSSNRAAADIKKWYQLLENFIIQTNITKPLIYVVGNKIDAGNRCSEEIIYPYIEVSAKTGFGVNNLFSDISYALIREYPELAYKNSKRKAFSSLDVCKYCFCNIL